MSENLDLVRSIFAAWSRGDFGATDWADPEIEFEFLGGPDPVRSTGLGEMVERFREFLSAYAEYGIDAENYRELDGGRVLVMTRNSGRGKGSGMEIAGLTGDGANLFHIRDGRVQRLVLYWDRDRALADVGVNE